MKNNGDIRRRWLLNIVGVISVLGIVCVLIATGWFAWKSYAELKQDLERKADVTLEFLDEARSLDYDDFITSCISYTGVFRGKESQRLQYVDTHGKVVASSSGEIPQEGLQTSDVSDALQSGERVVFCGKDPVFSERVLSVSTPVKYDSDRTAGVMRFVASTHSVDMSILRTAGVSLGIVIGIILIVLLTSRLFINSLLKPVVEITEKAKRIAAGSYGVQIAGEYPDEIGELSKTINDLSAKLSQNEKMQAEFISSLSHELRTPLTVITGWSETLLSNDELDADDRRGMSIILRESKRLNEMVVDLLDFTRIQGDSMTLNIETADIRSDFEDTVFMYGSRLAQDGITLEYLDNDEEIPQIPCDLKRMRQVFLNILDNAAKHGGEGKKIQASIGFENDAVVIRIRDYGCGIPEDEIPLVKKKFYKGSSKARGTGIGLAVCDEIVQMHGGALILENAQGGGTLVTVSLPAAH